MTVAGILYWECSCGEPNSGQEDDPLLECRRCGLPYLLPEADAVESDGGFSPKPDKPVAFTPAKDRLSEGVKLYCAACYARKFEGVDSVALWSAEVEDAVARRGRPMAQCAECGKDFIT